jgi:predicted DNA-binding protein (MmcQ/YjbR family)
MLFEAATIEAIRGSFNGRVEKPSGSTGVRRLGAAAGKMCAMRADALRELCLALSGSEETFPFGPETSVFKVAGKMFALSRLDADPLEVSLKCEPLLAEQLREAHPAVRPGYHLNKRHWNTVTIDGSLAERLIRDMIEDSYDLVVSRLSRARQRALLLRCAE